MVVEQAARIVGGNIYVWRKPEQDSKQNNDDEQNENKKKMGKIPDEVDFGVFFFCCFLW